MDWYIILLIGLLPFLVAYACIEMAAGAANNAIILFGLFGVLIWATVLFLACVGALDVVKSPHPITPELRITVKDSVQDTMYIYR